MRDPRPGPRQVGDVHERLAELSGREREVLQVSNVLTKHHLCSHVQAAVLAYEAGLVQRGEVAYEQLRDDA